MSNLKNHFIEAFVKIGDEILQNGLRSPFDIIQANTCFELMLQSLSKFKLKNPEYLDVEQLRMPVMIDLCVSLGSIEISEAACFKKFNSLRNKISHSLETDTAKYFDEVENSLGGRVKMLYEHFKKIDSISNSRPVHLVHSMNQFLIKELITTQGMDGWSGFEEKLDGIKP